MDRTLCNTCAHGFEAFHGCLAGGDDFDNVIVDWLIKEHLRPAVSSPGMLSCHVMIWHAVHHAFGLTDMQCIMLQASCPLPVPSQCSTVKLGTRQPSVATHILFDSTATQQRRVAGIVHVATYSLLVAGCSVAAPCSPVTAEGCC